MKKIISLLTLLLLFSVTKAEAISRPTDHQIKVVASKATDLRATALENVLNKYQSPLAPYAGYFIKSSDKNEIDWKLLPSIAGLESSFGKRQMPGSYNSYGWGGGHIYFDSVEDGIDTVLFALKNKYASRGATTVETIAPIYSESNTWAPRINSFMQKFEAEYSRLEMMNIELTI